MPASKDVPGNEYAEERKQLSPLPTPLENHTRFHVHRVARSPLTLRNSGHTILLKYDTEPLVSTTLQMLRNRPSVINWIESYFRQRSFQVSVKGSLSHVAEAASGVLQASVLGPILFVIYVNN